MADPSHSLSLLQAKLPSESPRPLLGADILQSPSVRYAQGTNEGQFHNFSGACAEALTTRERLHRDYL